MMAFSILWRCHRMGIWWIWGEWRQHDYIDLHDRVGARLEGRGIGEKDAIDRR